MTLALGYGLNFQDLYNRDKLAVIDDAFMNELAKADQGLADKLKAARANPSALQYKEEAELLLAVSPVFEGFMGKLFGIEKELAALKASHSALDGLYSCKRLFVQRKAAKAIKPEEGDSLNGAELTAKIEALIGKGFDELQFAAQVNAWMADDKANADKLDIAAKYAAWALYAKEGIKKHGSGILFQLPAKLDPQKLVHTKEVEKHGVKMLAQADECHLRYRYGFDLTDQGMDLKGGLDETNYCIFCHRQGKDNCSKGNLDKKTNEFAQTAIKVTQTGCPLEERISEMQELKTKGLSIASLATVTIDNPMVAGTGHRICNDCMAACIYNNQNRDPVNIPEAETRNLKDVLALPYGFEVYSLLTRWNPLNIRRPVAAPHSGRKVLVVGLGPAGYTLAHYLMNEGHHVVAIDGLKIEPLDPKLSGVTPKGERVAFEPVKDIESLWEPLGSRVLAGFGGVAEYGITVRWDKNFLKVIRLLLERRSEFAMFPGVRMGGTVTVESAFKMGFDHVAMCMGAGKPTVLAMKNGLARGVRQASDFLMALQLTGAAKEDSLANLQIRLPVVVVGGGLTAIDTCTEALAYYPLQVEKFLKRYEILCAEKGEEAVRSLWNPEEKEIAEEFIGHAKAIRAEMALAAKEGRNPRLLDMLNGWGGATLAYRRTMLESPAYRNFEEIVKAMEEGIVFAEKLTPTEVVLDDYGHAKALKVKHPETGEHTLPARSILIAAGTVPNTVLAREHEGFALDGKYFQAYDENGNKVKPQAISKPKDVNVLMHFTPDGHSVSFFGDLHPSYAGNVVSAMASARQGYPVINRMLAKLPASSVAPQTLFAECNKGMRAYVHSVQEIAPNIVEVVLKAPLAASGFKPGQFYRLQNFEMLAPKAGGSITMGMEGVALTGAWVKPEEGLVALIVLEMGGSSSFCRHLKKGEPVVLMGPTGAPTEVHSGETVLLAGGGLGNAVLFSIGQALRKAGSKVLYFAGYRRPIDRFKVEEIHAAADVIIWGSDEGPAFVPERPQDKAFVGNIVQAMVSYAEGKLGDVAIPLNQVDRMIVIGSDRMMAAVGAARHGILKPFLKKHEAVASINSPMQCMMKEVCGQCLQRHQDPETGEESVVFTCFNQDQPIDFVDFKNLNTRLAQNGVHEKLTKQWLERAVKMLG